MDMGPPIIPEPQATTSITNKSQNSLRNPLPLTASQEAQVRDLYYKRVRSRCADEIKGMQAKESILPRSHG